MWAVVYMLTYVSCTDGLGFIMQYTYFCMLVDQMLCVIVNVNRVGICILLSR